MATCTQIFIPSDSHNFIVTLAYSWMLLDAVSHMIAELGIPKDQDEY